MEFIGLQFENSQRYIAKCHRETFRSVKPGLLLGGDLVAKALLHAAWPIDPRDRH
jgi:hypothetical protein